MGSLLRFVAIAVSGIVVLGFVLFALDEADKGSQTQQQKLERELGSPSPSARGEAVRERQHGAFREAVDDANDVLLAPFVDLIDSDNSWVNHGVPALLALLLYGVGLGLLANWLPKERAHGGDWRAAGG
jgi:hypothetical protein